MELTTASLQGFETQLHYNWVLTLIFRTNNCASLEQTTAKLYKSQTASLLVSASENRVINPSTGGSSKNIRQYQLRGSGLFINDEKIGFVDENIPSRALISSSESYFSYPGSNPNNYLEWNGTTLKIGGEIVLTNGSPSTNLSHSPNSTYWISRKYK